MRKFLTQMGFTMAELMIGMAVVAIMAGVGAPSLSKWMDNYRIKAAARDLYSEIQLTRLKAVKTNQFYRMLYDTYYDDWSAYYVIECKKTLNLCWPEGGAFYGFHHPDNDWDYTFYNMSLDSDGRILFKHPQGSWPVDGEWGDPIWPGVITFNPNGTTDGTAELYVADRNNTKNYRVRIQSRAGTVTVERYDGSGGWL
jgi:prepilin-type N-terminal cleavage/methylation domain-containing protein